ncbi:MAG: helix-turn-helix transcriptional regulator [Eubacteriales bacterium]
MVTTLDILKQLADGISVQFGQDCEVVIHDLVGQDLDHSIVYIKNGKVSGRCVGEGCSAVVMDALRQNPDSLQDKFAYLTKTEDGRVLKSSTSYIRDESGAIHYIFSINFDITRLTAIEYALDSIIGTEESDSNPVKITHNVNELLDNLIEQSVALAGKPVAMMNKEDKIVALDFLNRSGAFLITRSGDKVSNYFGISKFTLYSYIEAGKEQS